MGLSARVGMGNVACIFNFDSLQALSGMDLSGDKNFPIHLKPVKVIFRLQINMVSLV